jgi:hypothetical protein
LDSLYVVLELLYSIYHYLILKPKIITEKREREREKETGDVNDIYMAFSDLSRPEMKPGDLSGGPRKSRQEERDSAEQE